MARDTKKLRSRSRKRGPRSWRERATTPTAPRVLVTGAASSVGIAVVQELADLGHPVTALDLPGSDFAAVDVARVGCRPGDIRDRDLVSELVRDAEVVVNLASAMGDRQRFEDLEQINLHAVRDLYEACTTSGVGHLVQLSTGAMYPSRSDPLAEETPPSPFNGFERTKLAADEFLLGQSSGGSMPVTILRPAVLVGPGRQSHVATLAAVPAVLAELTSRVPRLVGGPCVSWVHVQDVARALVVLMERDPLRTGVFNVAAPQPVPLGELLDTVMRTAELDGRSLDVAYPAKLLRLLRPALGLGMPLIDAGLRRRFARMVRGQGLLDALRPELGSTALRRALESRVLDTTRLEDLGFEPAHTDLTTAWEETVRKYRENRWLP